MKLAAYICGPMSGKKDYNFPAFHEAAETLRGMGYIVYDPAEEDEKLFCGEPPPDRLSPAQIQSVIRHDLHLILDRVDILVMLPGWEYSKGAKLEFALGRFLGLDVYQYTKTPEMKGIKTLNGDLYFKEAPRPYE